MLQMTPLHRKERRTEGLLLEEGDVGWHGAGKAGLLLLREGVVAQAQVHRADRQ